MGDLGPYLLPGSAPGCPLFVSGLKPDSIERSGFHPLACSSLRSAPGFALLTRDRQKNEYSIYFYARAKVLLRKISQMATLQKKWSSCFLGCCLILMFAACQPENADQESHSLATTTTNDPAAGTRQMRDSINNIIAGVDFSKHPYETARKLAVMEPQILAAQQQGQLTIPAYIAYGETLLEAGRSQDAINVFENLLERFPENKTIAAQNKGLHEALALCYLRLGEQRNCIENHSSQSCIFPIAGDGIHINTTGSAKAITIYENILRAFPDDLRSRWLLNLAYMTLGKFPQEVPKQWLIDPQLFASKNILPPFENIAMHLGIDVNDLAGGIVLDDFNGDGNLDVLASSWDLEGTLQYFVNNGNGTFTDQTQAAGLNNVTGGLNLIQGDYNNDGFLDFYVLRSAWSTSAALGQLPNSLIKNNGDGTFSDVTIAAGIYRQDPSQAGAWTDLNNDGWLDLVVTNETSAAAEPHPCQVFINQQNGTFKDIAPQTGLNLLGFFKGLTVGDLNNDGWPDLYFSNLDGLNQLFLNTGTTPGGDISFRNISQAAGVEAPRNSFPTWFFDYNNDGYEDLYVTNFDQTLLRQQTVQVAADYLKLPISTAFPCLYKNNGDGTFTNVTNTVGLNHVLPAMGCNFGDLDNDGFLDFYLGSGAPDFRAIVPNRMLKNQGGQQFLDVTYDGGFGHIQKGHGISFADMDNDGDQDIYAVMGGSVSGDFFQNAFFENPGNNNDWVTLRLAGTTSNRSAIGARIKMMVTYKDGTNRTIYHTINSGGSFGANSLQAELGLGANVSTAALSIDWPDGKPGYIDYGTIPTKAILHIKEGSPEVKTVKQGKIELARTGGSHEH